MVLTMPDTMSLERRVALRAFGADVVLTTAKKGLPGARYKAQEIRKEILAGGGDALIMEQFENMSNALIHRETTGPEIWRDCGGSVDYVVSGVGTGGTVTGIAQYLKEQGCGARIVAVEPQESAAMTARKEGKEFKPSPHKIQGMGAGFVPNAMDLDIVDEVCAVHSDEAMAMSRRLAREEGLLSGISAGAIVAAACRIAEREEAKDKTIVAIVPSAGERYLSTALFLPVLEECQRLPVVPESEL